MKIPMEHQVPPVIFDGRSRPNRRVVDLFFIFEIGNLGSKLCMVPRVYFAWFLGCNLGIETALFYLPEWGR